MTNTSLYQQGDVLLFIEDSLIEINITDGITEMTPGLETMVLLCLAGGNIDDTAGPDTESKQWMGNEDEDEQSKLRSRFYSSLQGLPLTSGNLTVLQEAAIFDITAGFGTILESVVVQVSIVAKNRVSVTSDIKLTSGTSDIIKLEFEKK